MAFVLLGLVLLVMKSAEFGPVAGWSWMWVLSPFVLAVAWWIFADSSGLTKRRAMDKLERTKVERRNRNLEALGMSTRRHTSRPRAKDFPVGEPGRRAKDSS